MKQIAILGSTGSIGTSALTVIDHLSDQMEVVALAARSKIDLLEQQIARYRPKMVAVYDVAAAKELRKRVTSVEVLEGMEGLCAVAAESEANLVLSAIAGTLGLAPTVAAIEAKRDVALANKEALVSGGAMVMQAVREAGVKLIPVDSEHSAIFQCLQGEEQRAISRIVLTASGGPFRGCRAEELSKVSVEEALAHPNWRMGPKVTIDCSTLMNKGLEVIEAYWLFGVAPEQIEVVIHPQSIVHSMVEFCDRSVIAQLGEPTMKTPIQYALTYPNRMPSSLQPFDLVACGRLDFQKPDSECFPCLSLAFEALRVGGSLACYMNAANEVLVERFLAREVDWVDIGSRLELLMERHRCCAISSLDEVYAVDEAARCEAAAI